MTARDAIAKALRSLANCFISRFLTLPLVIVSVGFLFSILRSEVDLAKICFSSFALLAGLPGVSLASSEHRP